jgi:hypothetical protein
MSSDDSVRRALDALTATPPPAPAISDLAKRRQVQIRRRRTMAGGLVACIAVAVLGVAAVTNSEPNESTVAAEGDHNVAMPDPRPGTSAPSTTDDAVVTSDPACGPGLASTLSTPDPGTITEGPAPGADAALDGQTVIHWTAGSDVFELRWPAGPEQQPLYGEPSPEALNRGISSSAGPEGLRVDIGGASIGAPDAPELVFSDLGNMTAPGCDVVQFSYWSGDEHAALGLRLVDELTPHAVLVDVGALVIATVEGTAPPETVIGCDNTAYPNKSGAPEGLTPQPSPAEALQHFLQTDVAQTFAKSGWTEFVIDSTAVTYGWETSPGNGDYAVVVETSRHQAGWLADNWTAAGC